MTYKIAVTKSGFDVLTETNPNNFIFNSDYNTFKIISEGTMLNQYVSSDLDTFTYVHNLGYIPGVFAFVSFSGKASLPEETEYGNLDRWWYPIITSTKVDFVFRCNTSCGYYVNIKYYIFAEVGS